MLFTDFDAFPGSLIDGDRHILHGGDTIWYGSWWMIAKRFRRFDAPFLPVNRFFAYLEGMAPSNVPATLTPMKVEVAGTIARPPARLRRNRVMTTSVASDRPIGMGRWRNC
jgi:hypothetical protein